VARGAAQAGAAATARRRRTSSASALEWTLRVVLCSALAIHSVLDITDLCHGGKSYALQVEDSIPRWLLPAVGILRAVAAIELFSDNPYMVLGALAYAAATWSGAVYFHLRRKHHPAAPLPAGFFMVLVAVGFALRVNLWFALADTVLCALVGVSLGWILVTPAREQKGLADGLLDGVE